MRPPILRNIIFTIMAKQSITKDYRVFFTEIKEKIYQAQYEAMKQVNKALINLYWEIGKSHCGKTAKA